MPSVRAFAANIEDLALAMKNEPNCVSLVEARAHVSGLGDSLIADVRQILLSTFERNPVPAIERLDQELLEVAESVAVDRLGLYVAVV